MKFFTILNLEAIKPITFMICLVCSLTMVGQSIVSGKVIDSDELPLTGATVIVVGNDVNGTITDLNGAFVLETMIPPPFAIEISYIGYRTVHRKVKGTPVELLIELSEETHMMEEITVSASRISESVLESQWSVEVMPAADILLQSTPDFYDGIQSMKGVSVTQSSMTYPAISTRGFGSANNLRFVQLIDGMDNAAPLLNFAMGNVVGISELDAYSVELVPGTASALYGPNAFNGILMMNSKNPYDFQGLSAQVKGGITDAEAQPSSEPYYQLSLRYAKALINDKFAFKLNASILKATDWLANDYTSGIQSATNVNATEPGDPNFNGTNLYGDEAQIVVPMAVVAPGIADYLSPILDVPAEVLAPMISAYPTLDIRRTGFKESDLLESNKAESIKLGGAVHYRFKPELELSYTYRFGQGSTVYQGGERYALRDFQFHMQKLELTGKNLMLRAYSTRTDAGDSYNLTALGSFANERFSPSSTSWVPTYATAYSATLLGYEFNELPINADALAAANQAGREAADQGIPPPGTAEYDSVIGSTRTDYFQRNPPGAGFIDESKLYHVEGVYDFPIKRSNIGFQVGGNYRTYSLFTDGTVYNEDPEGTGENKRISIGEYGLFLQYQHKFVDDRLSAIASLRYDKNENFDGSVSPRVSLGYAAGVKRQHNFRASFQTGFRNPSTQQQYIFFPGASGILLGSTEANAARYGVHNGGATTNTSYNAFIGSVIAGSPDPSLLETVDLAYVKPERLSVFEVGYKSIISSRLFIDFNVYHNMYRDFLAQQTVRVTEGTNHKGNYLPGVQDVLTGQSTSATAFRLYTNSQAKITSTGVGLGLDYKLTGDYHVHGHYTFTTYSADGEEEDFEAGFNMPENIFLIGVKNREVINNLGFGVDYRWQSSFYWENAFGHATIPAYGTLNANVFYEFEKIKTTLKVGGTNLVGTDYRTHAGGPFVGRTLYVGLTYQGWKL